VPFTISHIAAVLPARRPLTRAGMFTATVIGSMVPDFALLPPGFITGMLAIARWETHAFRALFTFCLPVGLVAYWLTELLIRPAALEVMPDGAYMRIRAAPPPPSIRRLSSWLQASAGVLIGAMTHLVWDAFTHEDARGVRMFPMLSDYGPEMQGHPAHLYRWLQHGSSAAGMLVVVCALLLWLRHAPAPPQPPVRRISAPERVVWLAAYIVPPILAMAWLAVRPWGPGMTPLNNSVALGAVTVRGMQVTTDSLLLVSLLIRARLAGSGAAASN
jgi:hypothetical protein